MIKFTDVCKAYIRYFYVILITIGLALGLTLGLTVKDKEYKASSTLLVKENADRVSSGEFISGNYAELIIDQMTMRMGKLDFVEDVIDEVAKVDADFAASYDSEEGMRKLRNEIKIEYNRGKAFFVVTYNNVDRDRSKLVADIASELIIKEYEAENKTSLAKIEIVGTTETNVNPSKTLVYAVIGILIGLVAGVVLVTFFVVFNPFVENADLLEKETGISVLATLDKVRGE